MDPLSITASTLTLIQATGAVAAALGSFVRSLRTVDSRIASLCDELATLKGFLEAIDGTLQECRKHGVGLVGDGLWDQSDVALKNCQSTIDELHRLVDKIKGATQSKAFGWKARAVVDFKIYGDDLVACRDKIHQSNSALQTIVHAITVSLSLKNNASQDLIIQELDKLKSSINEALYTSSRPIGGFYKTASGRPDTMIANNLRQLAEAAKSFHIAASSTAGTVHSDMGDAPWQSLPGADISLFGDFPDSSRERVEQYLENDAFGAADPGIRSSTPFSIGSRWPSSKAPSSRLDSVTLGRPIRSSTMASQDEVDDDDDLEHAFLQGLRELAIASIKNSDYDRAIQFLQEAMAQSLGPDKSSEEYRQMQIQLTLCYFLQGKWRMAEPLVIALAKSNADHDLVVCNLLHALALGYLSAYSFDQALATCKKALQGKKRLCTGHGIDWREYTETLGLFVTIFDVTGDYIKAEVFRRKLPKDFQYSHPANEAAFIQAQVHLLVTVLGDNVPVFTPHCASFGAAEHEEEFKGLVSEEKNGCFRGANCPNGDCSLRMKLAEYEKYELDTMKEVSMVEIGSPNDGDDEASPSSAAEPHSPLRRRFSRLFGSSRRRSTEPEASAVNSQEESPLSGSSPTVSAPKLWWFKHSKKPRPRKPKAGFRKVLQSAIEGPSEEEGTFKLLRMKRVATPGPMEVSRRFSWSSETCRPYLGPQTTGEPGEYFDPDSFNRLHDEPEHNASSDGIEPGSSEERPSQCIDVAPYVLNKAHQQGCVLERAPLPELADTSPPAELHDICLDPAEVIAKHCNLSVDEAGPSATDLHRSFSFVPGITDYASTRDKNLCTRDLKVCTTQFHPFPNFYSLEIDALEACVVLVNQDKQLQNVAEESCTNNPDYSPVGAREDTEHRDKQKSQRKLFKPRILKIDTKVPIAPLSGSASPEVSKLVGLISQISFILASLPDLKDGKELGLKYMQLKAMLPELKVLRSDENLLYDVKNVIRRLGSRLKKANKRAAKSDANQHHLHTKRWASVAEYLAFCMNQPAQPTEGIPPSDSGYDTMETTGDNPILHGKATPTVEDQPLALGRVPWWIHDSEKASSATPIPRYRKGRVGGASGTPKSQSPEKKVMFNDCLGDEICGYDSDDGYCSLTEKVPTGREEGQSPRDRSKMGT